LPVDINISNYEEFLLSYIDGELNDGERAAVEAFLQQHPEQAKELEVLKAAVLRPDNSSVFGDKQMLYRSTQITTDNYEGFLLSYIDGELNTAEQQALEAFLKKHPHLQQELETWQSTRLSSDKALHFSNREMLYRHTASLTLENYESYLLSYIDGELSAAEEQTLHAFLQQHPQLQATLQLFQRTRLQPDPALRMPGKRALYRHTGSRTIRPAWWWGAAAAVVAGCLVWLLPLQQDSVKTVPPVTAGNNTAPARNNAQQQLQNVPARPIEKAPLNQQQVQETPALALNTPAAKSAAAKAANPAKNRASATVAAARARNANTGGSSNTAGNAATVLAQLPQPRATSEEVVQQHMEKTIQAATPPVQEVTVTADHNPVLATTTPVPHTPAPKMPEAVAPAPAVQGELIMSVTSSSESKLLNGVASVAKFFSRKKHKSE
jgi:anti-sigma factor RsiW